MSLKFTLSALVALASAPALAQTGGGVPAETTPAAPAQPSPERIQAIQTAAQAFSACVSAAIPNVPATVTPDAGATSVLAGCGTQRQGIEAAVEALISSLPAAQQAEARSQAHEQMTSQLATAQTQIAAAIAGTRSATAAAPAAATPAH